MAARSTQTRDIIVKLFGPLRSPSHRPEVAPTSWSEPPPSGSSALLRNPRPARRAQIAAAGGVYASTRGCYNSFTRGGVAEWSNAPALKADEVKASRGSNPFPSVRAGVPRARGSPPVQDR
jgi:hypothetical protein